MGGVFRVCIALCVAVAGAGVALGQPAPPGPAAAIPRTPDGRPELEGNWSAAWLTPFERPAEASRLELSAEEAAALREVLWQRVDVEPLSPLESIDVRDIMSVGGRLRSSLIVDPPDGRLPLAAAARAGRGLPQIGFNDPEQRLPAERCMLAANTVAPFFILPAGNLKRIVQTADHVVILSETMNALRIIPVRADVPGVKEAGRGHWEGDTLVVETSGFAPDDRMRLSAYARFPISPRTVITERLTRSGPDEILYSYTVADPDLYSSPWTAEIALRRTDDPLYEFACHEGNYGLVGILQGARETERRAAAKPKP